MTELRALIEIVDAFGTPILAVIAWVLWRVKSNDLPHLQSRVDEIGERMARIEGIEEGARGLQPRRDRRS